MGKTDVCRGKSVQLPVWDAEVTGSNPVALINGESAGSF